jgi:hypothetical protein
MLLVFSTQAALIDPMGFRMRFRLLADPISVETAPEG